MFAPVFSVAVSDLDVTDLLGTNPTRFYPFGEAPQNVLKPYAVYQTVSGSPYNTLDCPPKMDRVTIQVDCYGTNAESSRDVALSLRDAFEMSGQFYVVSWRGESREKETNLFRVSFDIEAHVPR